MPHPRNINAPVLEGFYKYQCRGILQALGPSNILVVFYCLLLCHRQYKMCGVRSSVNNSTLCWCARSPLGRSHMEHCQHQLLGHIQYIITRGGALALSFQLQFAHRGPPLAQKIRRLLEIYFHLFFICVFYGLDLFLW